MRRIYAFFCALFCAFALFANDVTGFVALEFGGNKTSYLIKNVQHVDINNMPDGKAEMSVLRKDGVSMPNVRTLIFSEEVLFTVQFVNYDGTVLQSSEMSEGEMPTYTGETPTRESTAQYIYTFNGWEPTMSPVVDNVTYTATYSQQTQKYTIQFVNYDGTVLQSEVLEYGTMPSFKGENPTKSSTAQYAYAFTGWDSEPTVVTESKVYTAMFASSVNSYTVSFVNDNGDVLQSSQLAYGATPVYNGATPVKPATAEFTYSFAGWSPAISAVTGAQTYTATYSSIKNQYEIIFQNEDGTELQRSNVTYGETPVYNGATPVKDATAEFTYTFAGWSPAITMVEGAQIYTATYSSVKNQYEVVFQNEDGTVLQRSNVTYGETPKYNGETPVKEATAEFTYTFAGWSPSITAVEGSQTYIATYSSVKNQYEVVFQNEDGTELQRSNVTYGEIPAYTGETPTKEATAEFTYSFAGWSPAITVVEGAQTYTATYSSVKNQYEVIFQNEDGTELQRSNVTYGEIPAYTGETPTKEATAEFTYTFAGWSPAITMVEGAQTYTATYTAVKNQYEVIFQNEDGTELQRSNVTYGETPVYAGATPEKAATAEFTYTFAGWSPAITMVEGAQTYTATYSSVKNQYEVIFQNEDGTELQRSNVTYGETPKYNGETPEKPATAEFTYTFAGWSPAITVVEGTQTYTATYSSVKNQYEVVFQNEDGTELQRSNVTYGETPKYNGETPTKAATAEFTYTFAGWSPTISAVEGAQTYTATFNSVKNQYEIIFQNEDGTELQKSDVTYGEVPVYSGATPTKEATVEFTYTFAGWSPSITAVEGAQTYTATYSSVKNQYEVVFQNEDGTELQRSNVTYGETPKYNGETPVKEATAEFTYTFAGWSPVITAVEGAQTYTATFNSVKNQYEIIFQNEDGTELQKSDVTYGEVPVYSGATPTKEATAEFTYTFAGWSPVITAVEGAQTYTATFNSVKNQYEIIFQNEDGTELQKSDVTYGEVPVYSGATPTKEATAEFTYTFAGWSPTITSVTGAQTYTATYSSVKNQYEVIFQNEDGTVLQRSNVTYGETPKYNGETPVKEATAEFTYTFAGWSPSITAIEGAQTYTATYSSVKNQYELIFQNEDGTELQRSNVTYGETPKYNGETPTKAATAEFTYTFAGWSPSITAVEGAQTYTATYSSVKNQYEVIFQNEDGTELQKSDVTYGEVPVYSGATPTKEATAEFTYTFAGWSPAITMVEGVQTYTATYSSVKNQYEVVFQNEDGTELQSSNVTYGETPKYNGETPTKDATAEFTYTFAGWSPAITIVEGAQTYTATYSSVKNQYEVIFQNEDGTELQRSNVTYGETPKYNGETPVKPATAEFTYTFAGWSPAITMVEGAQVYTATYSSVKNQYEVIFQNEDGTELQRSNVTYGETPKYNGETPVKEATAEFTYTFAGWSPAITMVEGAQTYTATYSSVKNQYEVIFQNEDGTELQRGNVTYGETPKYNGETPTKPATAEFTYTFAGWSPAITMVEGAQTYTATYSSVKNQYEVIFQNEDGTVLQRSNVTYGETPVYNGATPTKEATAEFTYTFKGWSPAITMVEGAQTYIATYSSVKNQYEIIFQNEDGTELQRSNLTYGETPVYAGATPEKPATAEFTYTFAGWSPSITSVTGAQTYTATYSSVKNQYEVIFQNEDGTELQRSNVTYGETPKYNGETPVKEATAEFTYTFAGWSPSITAVTGAQTYTATYSSIKNQYEVIFQNEDGTELQRSNVTYGETPVYTGETPVKDATAEFTYTFAGWSPAITMVEGAQTYTATYSSVKNQYEVIFQNEDGTELQRSNVTYGETPKYNGETPTKAATAEFTYTFAGWSPAITMVEGAQTYTAIFNSTRNEYEVIFQNEDGTELQRSNVTYGETPKYNGETPVKEATAEFTYTFAGWSPAITMVEGAQTYTATYSSVKNQYEVIFQNEDGTELQRSNVTYGETPVYAGATPLKEATAEFTYTFAGWTPSITVVEGAQTYTATYSSIKNQYEIIFQNEDVTELQRSNVTYGETPKYNGATPEKAATAEFTYTFKGWSPAITVVEGAQTYTATYSSVRNQYEVVFQNEDGTELQRSNVTYGETPKYNGETPTKATTAEFTYTFAGWSPAITVVEGAQTYTATYSSVKNQYEIIFQNEDGTVLQSSNVTYGETPAYAGATPIKDATAEFTYTFAGWSPAITVVEGAQIYTATYSSVKNQYEVIFQNEDGTELQRSNVTYGETPVYAGATPIKDATAEFTYTFAGWSPAITMVEGAQTYTATYSSVKNQYEVIFQNEDGTELQRSNVTYGETPVYAGATPVKEATAEFTYTFAGWSPAITVVEGAQTYTATYSSVKNQYEVIFQNEDGTELQRSNVTYGETPKYNGETPVKEATAEFTYTFAGWSPAITVVEGAQIYTATYSSVKNQYEVIFQNEDGTELQRSNVTYGETPKYNGETPTKPATAEFTYTFKGWSPAISAVTGAQTYTATYSSVKNQYEIIFQNEDGTELQRSNVTYGETPVYNGETPVKEATAEFTYTFAGWSPAITMVEGAQTYTATYSSIKNQYEIIFQNEDGTELQKSDVTYGEVPVYSGATPTKEATAEFTYTFAGWSPSITAVEGAQTYTATYSSVKNQYEIIFQNEDGTVLQSSNVTYGETPVYNGATPTKAATAEFTYTFAGWSPAISAVTGAQTYTATYSSVKNQYEVIFQNEDGTELQRSNVTYGETPVYNGETPTKVATAEFTYTFAGWSPAITVVEGAQTYTATYSSVKNQYEVIFQNEDGTELQRSNVTYGETPVYNGETPTKAATAEFTYTFKGWSPAITMVEGAQTYTATYSSVKNQYEVVFQNEDGTELQRSNVTYGETPVYNGETPTKAATAEFTYTFAGWSPAITMVEGAQTYTATYSSVKNQYEVIFQNEDGTELQRSNVTYGETPVYAGATPEKAATAEFTYTFAGWSPAITMVEGVQTYTATYGSVKNQYEVVFQNEDGTELQRSNVTYGETPVYNGETPTKDATAEFTYTFAGWSPAITAVEGAQTYTATYSSVKNQYEVVFQNEDGTELQKSDVTYGEVPVYSGATPTKEATAEFTYTFAGWSPTISVVTNTQTYTATYTAVINKYTLTAIPQHEVMGVVTGSGVYEYGTKVELTVTKKYGYDFFRWSTGSTEPTIEIELVSDTTITAYFTENYCELHTTPKVPALEVLPVAVWGSELNLAESDNAIKEAISQQKGRLAEIKETWWEVNLNGTWETYNGQKVPKQETIEIRFALTTTCDSTEIGETTILIVECPNPENTEACKNAPSVNKYDWLLMLNVKEIKAQGYVFEEKDVTWYRITETNENPQVVGNGYSYTIDRSLLGTGSYYARIELPEQVNDVACKCIYGTQTYDFTGDGMPIPMLIPSIVAPREEVEVINLPSENAEIKVYDQIGQIYYIIQSNGEGKVSFVAQDKPGKYLVEIKTQSIKLTLKYIVR